ncbi:hypothetical protein [Burkholderia pseudomallei]|uniref:hypothetical protein n=1 Tax=Burkholderia pseudomallei TaxID=28450 RepID=UPI0006AD6014|nr:hypothetical protein [Burkholderia pseudomallei]
MTTTDKSRADALTDLSDDELALIREEAARITDDWCERQFMEPSQKESDAKFVREVLRLAASPSSQPAAAPADLQGLRRSILTSREIVRDQDGMLSHPAVPYLDEDVNYETFFAAFGIEATFIHMEDDVDGDTYEKYFESNSPDCSFWTPSTPAGDSWLLLEIFDTEDGPVALYVREKKPESMRERLKRERRERNAPAPAPTDERAATAWQTGTPPTKAQNGLTDDHIAAIARQHAASFVDGDDAITDLFFEDDGYLQFARALLAASLAETKTDERAAFNEAMADECPEFQRPTYTANDVDLNVRAVARSMWLAGIAYARAASATKAGAKGVQDLNNLAHLAAGLWANANTSAPEASAYRDGFIAGASCGVEVKKGPIKFVKDCPDYAAPQPAQADARVGLTYQQVASITWAIRTAKKCGYTSDAEVLKGLLRGANQDDPVATQPNTQGDKS